MGPHNRTPWNLIHKPHSSPINRQTWHHVLKKSRLQINDINRLQAPAPRLLFNSGVTQIGSRSVGEKTEAELLLGFVKSLPVDGRGAGPILVTFGGNGFDLPLLRYRAFALGVPLPGLHGAGHRNYWHRFGSDHIDLCDVLSGYGGSTKPSLAEMAALANIPVKIGGVDGSQVEAYVAEGRLKEVADYCLTDVLATFCVFLRYEMVRGELKPAYFDASMDSLKAIVQRHLEQWPLLSAFLVAS